MTEEKSKVQTLKDEVRDKTHRVNELEVLFGFSLGVLFGFSLPVLDCMWS